MAELVKRIYPYKCGVGYEGCVFETHLVYAGNISEAYYAGLKYLHPDKGFNYVTVTRLKKADAAKYQQ
jgi:hypothetical protein